MSDHHPLIVELLRPDSRYKRAWIDAAVEHRDELAPHLIRVLQQVRADPEWLDDDSRDTVAHLYALTLLTHWREEQGHEVMVDLLRLPTESLNHLRMGDWITETSAGALYATSGGRVDAIRELLEDRSAWEYVRCAAANALTFLAADQHIGRTEALDLLVSQLEPERAGEPSYLWTGVIDAMFNLHPAEYCEQRVGASESELVGEFFAKWRLLEEMDAEGSDGADDDLQAALAAQLPSDVHGHISWWAYFEEPCSDSLLADSDTPPETTPRRRTPSPTTGQAKRRDKAKKARKAARAQRQKRPKRKR